MIFSRITSQPFLAIADTAPDSIPSIHPRSIALAAVFLAGGATRRGALVPAVNLHRVETARAKLEIRSNKVSRALENLRQQSQLTRSAFASAVGELARVEIWGDAHASTVDAAISIVVRRLWQCAAVAWRWGVANELVDVAGRAWISECFELDAGASIVPPLSGAEWSNLLAALREIGTMASVAVGGDVADETDVDASESGADLVDIESE